jgi:hypothetical protein
VNFDEDEPFRRLRESHKDEDREEKEAPRDAIMVAERKNRSIVEASKVMIHDQSLPMHLWAKASSTAVYVQNRSPHKILGNKTPEEVFTGKKLEVSYLRIFGCTVYIHVPKEKRTKLEPSRRKGIFLGYGETSKGYRIYNHGQRQIEIS